MFLKGYEQVRVDMLHGQEGSEDTGPSIHDINAMDFIQGQRER